MSLSEGGQLSTPVPVGNVTPAAGTLPSAAAELTRATGRSNRRRVRLHHNQGRAALGFLLPNLLGFLVFTAAPVLISLAISFTNWDLQNPSHFRFIALENYRELLHDRPFRLYFVNTLYLMLGIPVAIAGSLFLAILLHQKIRGSIVYRTMFYLPSFTSGVALMLLWKALLNPDFGPINTAINGVLDWINPALQHTFIGALTAPRWLGSMQNVLGLTPESVGFEGKFFGIGARDALILMAVWTAVGGNNMLLYLAALTNVPPELYEAAEIDGAGPWSKFRHVTWPQLAPTTFFIVVMSVIGGLQSGIDVARVMTRGGPAGTTTTLTYYTYQKAFEEFQMGYASAVTWVIFLLIFGFTLVYWRAAGKEINY